jgi:hypothetical protein
VSPPPISSILKSIPCHLFNCWVIVAVGIIAQRRRHRYDAGSSQSLVGNPLQTPDNASTSSVSSGMPLSRKPASFTDGSQPSALPQPSPPTTNSATAAVATATTIVTIINIVAIDTIVIAAVTIAFALAIPVVIAIPYPVAAATANAAATAAAVATVTTTAVLSAVDFV